MNSLAEYSSIAIIMRISQQKSKFSNHHITRRIRRITIEEETTIIMRSTNTILGRDDLS